MHDLSTAQALETHAAILEKLRCCLPHLAPHLKPEVCIADLGIDSIDLVELLCLVSSEFHLRLSEPEYRSLRTVGDLVAAIAELTRGGQHLS